ncbi:hypothetical protein G6F37_006590 [Rhizopus arrhizus]|nr:hypothetical protein G6F38_003258 [Rhizopus arrhizus]KAG1157557.1 hypothetical protein G6F37_006590 [Rhizopus arrhizus]
MNEDLADQHLPSLLSPVNMDICQPTFHSRWRQACHWHANLQFPHYVKHSPQQTVGEPWSCNFPFYANEINQSVFGHPFNRSRNAFAE